MGSGKSFTSRSLGESLGKDVVSTDALIEALEGKPIATIFAENGEPYFRAVESAVVRDVVSRQNVVIDCGGGVIVNPENLKLLKENAVVVYLETSPEWVLRRVGGKKNRPLLNVPNPLEKIKELMQSRCAAYAQADFTVNTDGKSVSAVAQEILGVLGDDRT